MIKEWVKKILRIVFNIIVSIFLVRMCKEWTSIPRTNPNLAKAIYIFAVLLLCIIWLDLFKNKVLVYIKKALIVINIIVIIASHTNLSYWYLSIQSQEWQMLYYSSFFEPNGDLAMLQLLLEDKTLIVNEDDKYYDKVFEKLGKKVVDVKMNQEAILEKYQFEDVGHLRSIHLMYSQVFDLVYTGQTEFPRLYIAADVKAENNERYIFVDDEYNMYIFESDIEYEE